MKKKYGEAGRGREERDRFLSSSASEEGKVFFIVCLCLIVGWFVGSSVWLSSSFFFLTFRSLVPAGLSGMA